MFANDSFQVGFFSKLSDKDLKEVSEAANFMDCPHVLDACCAAIAIKYKLAQIAYSREMGMSDEEIRSQKKPSAGQESLDQ